MVFILPFLLPVHNIVFATFASFRCCRHVGNVTSSVWLSNGDAYPLVTPNEIWKQALLEFCGAIRDNGRHAIGRAGCKRRAGAADAETAHFANIDREMEVVKVLYFETARKLRNAHLMQEINWQRSGQVRYQHVVLSEGLKNVGRHFAVRLPVKRVWCQMF